MVLPGGLNVPAAQCSAFGKDGTGRAAADRKFLRGCTDWSTGSEVFAKLNSTSTHTRFSQGRQHLSHCFDILPNCGQQPVSLPDWIV